MSEIVMLESSGWIQTIKPNEILIDIPTFPEYSRQKVVIQSIIIRKELNLEVYWKAKPWEEKKIVKFKKNSI